ncbi:MAG: hypothetical protein IKO21_10560 [Fibrobacter sp.]|nr:hypothetical protein [Fibrobacter sp.]
MIIKTFKEIFSFLFREKVLVTVDLIFIFIYDPKVFLHIRLLFGVVGLVEFWVTFVEDLRRSPGSSACRTTRDSSKALTSVYLKSAATPKGWEDDHLT